MRTLVIVSALALLSGCATDPNKMLRNALADTTEVGHAKVAVQGLWGGTTIEVEEVRMSRHGASENVPDEYFVPREAVVLRAKNTQTTDPEADPDDIVKEENDDAEE